MIHAIAACRRISVGAAAALALVATSLGAAADAGARADFGDARRLSGAVRAQLAADRGPIDVIIRFRRVPGAADTDHLRRAGGRIRHTMRRSPFVAARLSRRAVEELARNPAVEFVAVDAPVSAALDVARGAAGVPAGGIGSPTAPGTTLTGAGVTVAVIDSGIAPHAELSNVVAAADFVSPGQTPPNGTVSTQDPLGHGTHVASIIAGSGSLSPGGALAGVAPGASLVSLRVLDGEGRGQTSDVIAALDWVLANHAAHGIRVVNLSLGHPIYEPVSVDPLVQAVEAVWDAGIVVVCSAGNLGRLGSGTVTSPCNSRKVITVGAANDRNTADPLDDRVTTFSSRGPTILDRFAKPDLVAPGNRIVAARATGSRLDITFPERRVAGDPAQPEVVEHFELSGTSMAAPMVAGTAALMLQEEPSLNPGSVKARLMLSARKPDVGSPLAFGAGVLDAAAALATPGVVADAPSPRLMADPITGVLSFENTAVLWGNDAFPLSAIWTRSIFWRSEPLEPVQLSDAVLWPDATLWPDGGLWGDGTFWPDASLWPDTTLWAEAVLWPDEDAGIVNDPGAYEDAQLVVEEDP